MTTTGIPAGTQAVDRAALLISTVVESDEPVAFAELAEECGLPKSTTSRLLTALERTELVERDDSGGYVAGPLFWRYAKRQDQYADLAALAAPIMEHVRDVTGETVNLGIARADKVSHVAQVDSKFLLGTRDWTEIEVPNHASALGKVLLAYGALPCSSGHLVSLTEHTICDPAQLEAQLAVVPTKGYAATTDELEVGLTGIAAPVTNKHGQTIAALGVSGPTPRLNNRHESIGRLLHEQAAKLAKSLGSHPNADPANLDRTKLDRAKRNQEGVA